MDQQNIKTLLRQPPELPDRTPFCLDDRLIAQYFNATLGHEDHQRVQRHVADCGYCQARVGVLARLHQEDSRFQPEDDLLVAAKQLADGSANRKLRHTPVWAAAAMIVLAFSVTTFQSTGLNQDPTIPSHDTEAIGGETRQVRSIGQAPIKPQLLSPLEGALVDPGELVIQWVDIPGSLFYDLYIMSDNGDLLVKQRVNGTRWTVGQPGIFEANAEYFVRIEAHMADARTLSSEHIIFRVDEE